MTDSLENAEKSISEQLKDALARLSKDQLRFVIALQDYPSKKEAAEAIGIKPDTAYRWNGDVEEAARLMALDSIAAARQMRRRALAKAMAVKIAGLDSEDERIRQSVSTEIIEGELGKAAQPLTGADGGPMQHEVSDVRDSILRKLAGIAAAGAADAVSEQPDED